MRLKDDVDTSKRSTKPKESQKRKKALTIKNAVIHFNGREKIVNTFKTGIFRKRKQGKKLKSISYLTVSISKY